MPTVQKVHSVKATPLVFFRTPYRLYFRALLCATILVLLTSNHSLASPSSLATSTSSSGKLSDALTLVPDIMVYNIGPHISYFIDRDSQYALDDLQHPLLQNKFESNDKDTPNFGYNNASYWLSFEINNQSEDIHDWYFELSYPLIDYYELHWRQIRDDEGNLVDKEWQTVKGGDSFIFSHREIAHYNFLHRIDITSGGSYKFYFRVKTQSNLTLPLTLYRSDGILLSHSKKQSTLALYFGFMLAMLLYNLFIYLSVREKIYLYYVAYIGGFTMVLLCLIGWPAQHLWPNSPWLSPYGLTLTVSATALAITLFTMSLLNTKINVPRLHKTMLAFCILPFAQCALIFILDTPSMEKFRLVFSMSASLGLFYIGVYCARKGIPGSRLYVFAWVGLFIGIIAYSLVVIGALEENILSRFGLYFGSAAEALLFSFGLAARYNQERQQKFSAQNKAAQFKLDARIEREASLKHQHEAQLKETESRAKSDFLASMSHEIRNPMTGILGVTDLLNDTPLTPQQRELLSVIKSSSDSLLAILNDILDFSKIEAGKLEMESIDFDLRALANEISLIYQINTKLKDTVAFQLEFDKTVATFVTGDPTRLRQIITNFLNNAFKFTQNGAIVLKVKQGEKNDEIFFSVQDSGIGISQEEIEKLFTSYAQADKSTSRQYGGTGLGLVICKRLAEAMGGKTGVNSEEGKGSEFWAALPLPASKTQSLPQASRVDVDVNFDDVQVLLAEDNTVNQMVVSKMLSKLNINCSLASNGDEAVAAFKAQTFDLILMDCEMPKLDGLGAAKIIRELEEKSGREPTPIIAFTGHVLNDQLQKCRAAGMNSMLEKPIQFDSLKKTLSKALQEKLDNGAQNSGLMSNKTKA